MLCNVMHITHSTWPTTMQLFILGQETSTPSKTGETPQLPSLSESLVVGDEMDISIATIDANISFAQSDAILRDRY